MAQYPFERSERLMRLMGQALVTWGEIETLWRMMLPVLLFRDFKHPQDKARREIAGQADDELSIAEVRAYTLWDGILNSATQLDLVLKTAPIVLTSPDQAKGLAKLLAVGKATHDKRSRRNGLAHSAFDRTMRWEGGPFLGRAFTTEEILRPARHAHSSIRGQDLEVVIPEILEDFKQHRESVRQVWSWLRIGIPKDAGPPLPDKSQKRSKGRSPNQEGPGREAKLRKRPRRPEASQE